MKETVEQIIAILRQPLSDDERQAGWRKSVKDGYVPVFTKLLAQIEQGEDRPYFGIVRSLDAYGIGGGHLYDMMLRVANETNAQLR
jgi:hypothetical protein